MKKQRVVCTHCRKRVKNKDLRISHMGFTMCETCTHDTGLTPPRIETNPEKWGGHAYKGPKVTT